MTADYIKTKIENKVNEIENVSCLIPYCIKTFSVYFTEQEIIDIINNITSKRKKNVYKSSFSLGN